VQKIKKQTKKIKSHTDREGIYGRVSHALALTADDDFFFSEE
jgi:hypothetical protein